MSPRGGLLFLFLASKHTQALADLRREAEPNDLPPVAQALVHPTSIGGTIGIAGDVDSFAVETEPGQTIRADILARGFRAGSAPGSDLSAVLEIVAPDGVTVLGSTQSQGEFDDPAISVEVSARGRYFINVRDDSRPQVGRPTGTCRDRRQGRSAHRC